VNSLDGEQPPIGRTGAAAEQRAVLGFVPPSRPMLWAACVRATPLIERGPAARAAGLREMSAFPIDVRAAEQAGHAISEITSRLADDGVRVTVLDPFTQWLPDSAPTGDTPSAGDEFLAFDEAEFLRLAEGLGVDSLSLIEATGRSRPVPLLVEHFGRMCDLAANRGLAVHLEFIPFTGVPDLATAWEVVRQADRPNGGLVFDIWHYLRGPQDSALLAEIPGDRILRVQVADGLTEPRGDFMNDLLHHRLTPGEGELGLEEVLQQLAAIDALHSVGPEVFSDAYDALPPADAVLTAQQGVDALLERISTRYSPRPSAAGAPFRRGR
jgi:4-hydroxyphenylpyruvate dioxygenase